MRRLSHERRVPSPRAAQPLVQGVVAGAGARGADVRSAGTSVHGVLGTLALKQAAGT